MLTILATAFVLSGQTVSEVPNPALLELRRAAYIAMNSFGAATGRCLVHLPEGAKERLDARLANSGSANERERRLATSFAEGYLSGQAESSRSTLSAEQCGAMMKTAQARVEASIAALAEAGS